MLPGRRTYRPVQDRHRVRGSDRVGGSRPSVPKLTMRAAALFASAVVALAGLLLVAFPAMDQPWLDALEDIAPPVQTAFLSSGERFTRNEVLELDRARESRTPAPARLGAGCALGQDRDGARQGRAAAPVPRRTEQISPAISSCCATCAARPRASAPRPGLASANHWFWRDLCRSARKAACPAPRFGIARCATACSSAQYGRLGKGQPRVT